MKCKHKKGVECYLMKCENCSVFKEAKQAHLNMFMEVVKCKKKQKK
jgi:hypothetical protein